MIGLKLVLVGMQITLVGALFPNEHHWGFIYFGLLVSIAGLVSGFVSRAVDDN